LGESNVVFCLPNLENSEGKKRVRGEG